MRIDAVVLDMDGVLFDTERLYVDALRDTAADMALLDAAAAIHAITGRSSADAAAWLLQNRPGFAAEEYMATVRERFFTLLDREGLPIKPGAPELLGWLRERRVPTALATCSRAASAEHHLRAVGWHEGVFHAIITRERVERGKPAPDIYLQACAALGVSPAHALAVEDSYNGIRAAHAAGMLPVMVPDLLPPNEEITPLLFRRFDSLVELREWLAEEL